MDFEQIKVIWDSQNAQPLYAVNKTEMHTVADLMQYLGMFAVMAAGLWICVRCEERRIASRFEPRRRELEALRQKLSDPRR